MQPTLEGWKEETQNTVGQIISRNLCACIPQLDLFSRITHAHREDESAKYLVLSAGRISLFSPLLSAVPADHFYNP